MARREFRRGDQGVVRVLDAVVLLEARAQTLEDLDRLRYGRFDDVYFLEPTRECVILLENPPVFGVGRRPDTAQFAVCKSRLDQVRSVHHAARRRACADHRMNLVDEENGAGIFLELAQDAFQALFEVAAILRAGDQGAHVERIDGAVAEHVRHLVLDDHPRQALDERRLAYAGFADIQGIVLATPAENLDGALDLDASADERVDPPFHRQLVQVGRELLEGRAAIGFTAFAFRPGRRLVLVRPILGDLRQAVGDIVDDVEPGDILHGEQVGGVRMLLTEDRHQHVRGGDFFLAARLDMKHGTLQHALEAQRRLHFTVVVVLQPGGRLIDEILQILAKTRDVGAACPENFAHLRRIDDRQQQVLDGHELMSRLAGRLERFVETDFEFAA